MVRRYPFTLAAVLLTVLPWTANADILVVAPHPDDDIITSAGVIYRAHQRREPVKVVFVTSGDAAGAKMVEVRKAEAIAAQKILGTSEDNLVFLGYPDGQLDGIRRGQSTAHNWPTMVGAVADVLASSRPQHIFTTSEWDTHPDHATTYFLVVEAARRTAAANPGYAPTIHKTVVWPGDESWPLPADPSTYFTEMPHAHLADRSALPWKERESLDVPAIMQIEAANPKYLAVAAHDSQGGVNRYIGRWIHKDEFFWTEQVSGRNRPPVPNAGTDQQVAEGATVTLDGSASWDRNGDSITHAWRQVSGPPVTLSGQSARPTFTAPTRLAEDATLAFELVVSDGSLTSAPDGVLVNVRSSAPRPTYGRNLATVAAITASTQRDGSGQAAAKVADGVVDGYPKDSSREWVTTAEGVGAWIAMTWPRPVTIAKIVLHDRPNTDDQLIQGTVQFSDNSTLTIGPLANNGSAVEYPFPPRTVSSLRLTVTQVSRGTANIGLAEFQVLEAVGGSSTAPAAPIAPVPPIAPATPTAPPPTQQPAAKPIAPGGEPSRGPAGVNIAASAKVTASSERAPAQGARNTVDGVVAGYPAAPGREWATVGETAGAWIELRWAAPQVVSAVRLHDRPNGDDQILRATLTFSDGSSVAVGPLDNDGAATDLEFDPRRVTWVRLTIDATSSSTANVGLAELLVFASPRN
jgi:LmbE family N-acetylglucosaminyl deacetylase